VGTRKKLIWIRILILAVGVPLFLLAIAVCDFAAYLYSINDRFFPNISIDGVNVSYHTYEEAISAIKLHENELLWRNAEVSVLFPDGSALKITGRDARLNHNAESVIGEAILRGRGAGIIEESMTYLRLERGESENFAVDYWLDTGSMRSLIAVFVSNYNQMLDGSEPLISADEIVLVAGAGQVRASEDDIFDIALGGLYESLSCGQPVKRIYTLPETSADVSELVYLLQELLIHPVSAAYDPATKTVSQSVVGVGFDLVGAINMFSGVESGKTVSIDIIYTLPEVTKEQLENTLFRDLIAESITSIGGSANRLNNVVLASEAINGVILEPGEEFSFNRIVGKRTYERGYRAAPTIVRQQYVDSIGGGICQVSSTIYSAIKDTGLRVTERHPHGLPVSYLPRGRDATVSWGSYDFRFVNNTEYPLRVDVTIEGRTLTAQVFGTIVEEG